MRLGVTQFVISPGSRSTPLTYAAAKHPGVNTTVHFDERGAAFHALGIAKATGHPAVFICTSGTAVANALPAVVEADAAQVPLIILSADRPPELLDAGANQAIRQPGIYANYVRWETTLPCPNPAIALPFVLTTIDQAVHRAIAAPSGPVHINCMFREPLAPEPDCINRELHIRAVESWGNSGAPYTAYTIAEQTLSDDDTEPLRKTIADTKRGVVVVGQLSSRKDRAAAISLCEQLGWVVFPDIASGLRLRNDLSTGIPNYDLLLDTQTGGMLHGIDTVLHVGGAVTSKHLMTLLENHPPRDYIRVASHPLRHDPIHRVSRRVTCSLHALYTALADVPVSIDTEWTSALQNASRALEDGLKDVLSEDNLSEPSIARCLSELVPDAHVVYLGNSMPIRDWDRFAATKDNPPIVAANRGASGIDGTIATAAGYARGTGMPVTAVLGDLTTLHDINSLALLKNTDLQLILVVINNDGGGIFSFLPMADHPEYFEEFWGTPHGLTFTELAQAFQVRYANPQSISELEECYSSIASGSESALIEIRTNRDDNVACHRSLTARITKLLP